MAPPRPSYLKRQKEQARLARANEKRAARLERKRAGGGPEMGSLEDLGVFDALPHTGADDASGAAADGDLESAAEDSAQG